MPSWQVHLALANELKTMFDLSDAFVLGSVLPDVGNYAKLAVATKTSQTRTHYSESDPISFTRSGIDTFRDMYQNKLHHPLIIGYYVHLLTDNYFNFYTYRRHFRKDGKKASIILKDGTVHSYFLPILGKEEALRKAKQQVSELKRGDFKRFGNLLSMQGKLGDQITIDPDAELHRYINYPLTKEDITKTVDEINRLITKEVTKIEPLELFQEEELFEVYEHCKEYLKNILLAETLVKERKMEHVRKKV